MVEKTTEYITAGDLVSTMAEMRRTGGDSVVKRANFSDFPELAAKVEFTSLHYFHYASFGYIERLLRKFAAVSADLRFSRMRITEYREACGYFTGQMEVLGETSENNDTNILQEIRFAWEGSGAIETSWDNFSIWEVRGS